MSDVFSAVPALFLREAELRRGIELLYFGYRDFTSGPDALLDAQGLGRAHHRALYFIGRQPGLAVGDLLRFLKITKQSLARVVKDLQQRGLLDVRTGARDRRQRLLYLTESGQALERQLFDALRTAMQRAYTAAGAQAVGGFWQVLLALVDPAERTAIERLVTSGRG